MNKDYSSLHFPLPSQEDAFTFANEVGYPCLLRPSYVLRSVLTHTSANTCLSCCRTSAHFVYFVQKLVQNATAVLCEPCSQ